MKKATKATIKRLKSINTELARILLERIEIAQNIVDYLNDGYILAEDEYSKGYYTDRGLYLKVRGYERNVFAGAYSVYPQYIQITLTHGNNEVEVLDINRLSMAMAKRESIK